MAYIKFATTAAEGYTNCAGHDCPISLIVVSGRTQLAIRTSL